MFLTLLAATLTVTGGLTDSQVLQRDATGVGRPVVSGTTEKGGKLLSRSNGGAWSDLGQISPGPWMLKLPALPTGGPYRIDLRLQTSGQDTTGESVIRDIYVGDLWALAGQSNMVGRAKIDEGYAQDSRVRMFSVDGTWQLAAHPLHEPNRPGAGLGLEFGVTLARATNVPIGLVPCASGGTSMAQWSPTLASQGRASLYGNLLERVRDVGGRVAGVLWYQGENDTGTEPAAVYKTTFRQFISQLRKDLNQADLPFHFAQLARYVNHVSRPSKYYSEWNTVQEAQRLTELDVPHSRMVATIDLEQGDLIHLSRASEERLGRRFALVVQGKAGPRLAGIRWASHHEIRVRFAGVNGVLKAPGGRVFGFQTVLPDGSPGPHIFQASIDEKAHEIVLRVNRTRPEVKVPEGIDLWYGRGYDPICNVTDSADLALPMLGPIRMPSRPVLPVATK